MNHYLLMYDVVDDYVQRRQGLRDAHLKLAWESCLRGELVLGGALSEPVDKAILMFRGDSPEVAERFAKADPYVRDGLVKKWTVRQWLTVVGDEAASPVKP